MCHHGGKDGKTLADGGDGDGGSDSDVHGDIDHNDNDEVHDDIFDDIHTMRPTMMMMIMCRCSPSY